MVFGRQLPYGVVGKDEKVRGEETFFTSPKSICEGRLVQGKSYAISSPS